MRCVFKFEFRIEMCLLQYIYVQCTYMTAKLTYYYKRSCIKLDLCKVIDQLIVKSFNFEVNPLYVNYLY